MFLEALVDIVHETLACRRVGIVRRTAYDWREAAARGENVYDSESYSESDTSDGAGGGASVVVDFGQVKPACGCRGSGASAVM